MHRVLRKYKTVFVVYSFLFFSFVTPQGFAQETIRIMSYNLNNYSSNSTRNNALKSVIGSIDPDIIVGIELTSSSQANNFNNDVLNQTGNGTYSMGTFLSNPNNGSDNNAIYFKSSKFSFVSRSIVVSSGNHPTYRFTLTNNSTSEQLIIFGIHLSSGNTISGRNQRTAEANVIRSITDTYSGGVYFIAAGDFNFSNGTEPAFQVLLDTPNSGKFIDPAGFDGNHSWFSYDELFTYNTGGLFSRYDLILNSQSVVTLDGGMDYNPDSFIIAGNRNGSTGYPYTIASDHLPVYADYTFGNPLPIELTSFTAVLEKNNVKLHWETETEVNNYGFNIERNDQNINTTIVGHENHWVTIGFIEGRGNSNSKKYYDYTDTKIYKPGNYHYRLKQIDIDGSFEYSNIVSVNISKPVNYYLSQNYPNPFNPETRIDFTIPEKQFVNLKVYNALGEMIKVLINEQKEAGNYTAIFDASGLPSGLYICRIEAPGFAETKKMTLLK